MKYYDYSCALLPASSVGCVARGWTVTEPTTSASFWRVVVGRVYDAKVVWEHVEVRVRSH